MIVLATAAAVTTASAQDRPNSTVRMAYLQYRIERQVPHSFMEAPPKDEGIAGARIAILDNNTTGRFTGQQSALDEVTATTEEEAADAFRKLVGAGQRLILVDAPALTLVKL